MPPVRRTIGPEPFLIEMIGISTTPYPALFRDNGARR